MDEIRSSGSIAQVPGMVDRARFELASASVNREVTLAVFLTPPAHWG